MLINKIIDEDVEQIIHENNGLNELFGETVMITGASGMIGSYFVYTLMKLNEKFDADITIIPLVRNLNKLHRNVISNNNVNPVTQDVIEKIEYDGDVDYIFHAASPASPELMNKNPVETNFTNTLGTANALNFALEHNTKKFLFTSTREVYGQPVSNKKYFKENDSGIINQLIPRNAYAESKKAAENMCLGFKEEYGLNTKIVRLAHTFGPGMNINHGMAHVEFLKNVLNGENIVLNSDGSSKRTYTYISDSVGAIFKVILKGNDMVYNISNTQNEISVKELAETIISFDSKNNLELIVNVEEDDSFDYKSFKYCLLSSEKIINELGWSPKYSIYEGFERVYEYFREYENF